MPDNLKQVRLSEEERQLLLEKCVLPEDWRARLSAPRAGIETLVLTAKEVESLRDIVADRLQVAGFDENWGVNAEGRLLEGIIDKLIPRKGGEDEQGRPV